MAVGRLPPAGRGPSQAFGLAWASCYDILHYFPAAMKWKYLDSSTSRSSEDIDVGPGPDLNCRAPDSHTTILGRAGTLGSGRLDRMHV